MPKDVREMKSVCVFAALLIISGVACRIDNIAPITIMRRGEVIFSHVLYRNGDRMPAYPYPTDPYDLTDWPVPWGALTDRGLKQHFALGKWLRKRYGNALLCEHFSSDNIYVRSTDLDRSLQSALANLAGLYPPLGDQVWNNDLLWHPIPVHTVPNTEDWLIGADVPACPVYDAAMNSQEVIADFLDLFNNSRSIMQYISDSSGIPIEPTLTGLGRIRMVRDTLFIEDLYNKTLPEWTKKIYPSSEIDRLAQLYFNIPSVTPDLAKIRIGFLLKDMIDRSMQKYSNVLHPNRSVVVYSTHATVLSSMLRTLGILNNDFVHYAACLLFELRSTPTGPRIEIFYKESDATDKVRPLLIPNCGFSCPIVRFQELYENILPTKDFVTTCQL